MMATLRKRSRDDDVNVSEIGAPYKKVTVHGRLTELSPIKVSGKNNGYFDGKLSDGKKTLRMVSFSSSIHGEMEKFHQEASPMVLVDCKVEETSYYGDKQLEIIATNRSTVEKSHQKLNLTSDLKTPENVVEGEIVGVASIDEYLSCLNCKAKVHQISSVMGECSKCKMKVKISKCDVNSNADILFRSLDGQQCSVTILQKELDVITAEVSGASLSEKLLKAPQVKLCINNKDNIVCSASVL